ncbi:MAG: N-acetylglucosamine-6-phosphate deacetylase [Siphonobacter sp.]
MSLLAYYNAHLFTGETFLENQILLVNGETILGFDTVIPEGAQSIDCQGNILAPGFVDLQIYGGQGSLFTTKPTPETIQKTHEANLQGGTLYFQITCNTSPLARMFTAIEACQTYLKQGGKGLVGLHLEGPYFNPEKKGAHILEYIHKPTIAELEKVLTAAGKLPLYLTLAPEQADAEVLEWLIKSPIRVSAGHSNATYAQAQEGFNKGIHLVTHLFNAMSPFGSREPGLLGATFDSKARASIIVDGIHVDYASVRIAKKIMGDRLFLITDAVTDNTEGDYQFHFNPQTNRYEDPNGTLSGSSLSMLQAVSNCVTKVGIPLEEALRMASLYPAQSIDKPLGKIESGYEAGFILFDTNFQLKGYSEKGQFTAL